MAASKVSKCLNSLFRRSLSANDESSFSTIVEDYFCFESDDENDFTTGKIIIFIVYQISTEMNE